MATCAAFLQLHVSSAAKPARWFQTYRGVSGPFPSATHTWSTNDTIEMTQEKKQGISSLTEDGKPGGTFRTFFVWTSERERKSTKQYMRVLTGHFYFLLNRSFWFDLLGFNRSAGEERARPLFPPASIHLQRVLSLHQARHNKMQKIKRQSGKRTGLIFFSWSVW